jgi:phosphoribosyl 1,2-cyclic phosphodiesterase
MSAPSLFDQQFDDPAPAPAAEPITPAQPAPRNRHKPTALRLCVLGSGSGGNSSVLRAGDDIMLLDAGFGPVTTAKRLGQAGLSLKHLRAICLTHLDQDHFRPTWMRTLFGWKIRVFCHQWHVDALMRLEGAHRLAGAGLIETFDGRDFAPLDGITVSAVPLKHDTKGTFAFHITAPDGGRIGYATDLGHVPDALIERFTSGGGVDLLAIESNYDPPMQLKSNRPLFLKRRIMGGSGHLSNEEAFTFVQSVDRLSGKGNPQHIVLLHRSQQCNHPDRVREMFERDPSIAARTHLTDQRRRSRWFDIAPQAAMNTTQLNFRF